MDILSLVQSQLGGDALNKIAQQTGLDAGQVQQVLPGVLSSLMGGMANNAQQPGGAEALLGALGNHDGGILDNLTDAIGNPALQQDGQKIAGHVLGGNQQAVAQQLGGNSGIDAGKIMQIISIAAPIVMGVLGRQNQQQQGGGFDIGGLAGLLMGSMGGGQQTRGLGGDAGGGIGGMIADMVDQNNDGNVVDDVMGMLGGMFKK